MIDLHISLLDLSKCCLICIIGIQLVTIEFWQTDILGYSWLEPEPSLFKNPGNYIYN
jgi:hypothetical protein